MSWIKENYHVAALGGGALVLAGLGYLGYSGNKAVNDAFNAPNPPPGKTTTAEGGDVAAEVTQLVTENNPVAHQQTPAGRPVDLFTSVDLYTRGENKKKLLDLLKIQPVHPPIVNQWWVDHRIDPSYSDSPQKDQDGDGFNNLEEYNAKTDPNNPEDFGTLIDKLEVVKVESDKWRLLFKQVISEGFQFDYLFIPFGAKRPITNRIPASESIAVNDIFFKEDPGKGRFKLLKVENRAFNGPVGKQMRQWAIVEDQLPSKNKQKYELPFNANAAQLKAITFYDHRVTLRLNAIGEADKHFTLEESGTFSLPAGGEEKGYKIIEVKLDGDGKPTTVVVEYRVGTEIKTKELSVPAAPAKAPESE